jgi:hypothetical protein
MPVALAHQAEFVAPAVLEQVELLHAKMATFSHAPFVAARASAQFISGGSSRASCRLSEVMDLPSAPFGVASETRAHVRHPWEGRFRPGTRPHLESGTGQC